MWWAPPLIIMGTIVGSFGALYLKTGAQKISGGLGGLLKNTDLFLGCLFYGFSAVFYILGVRGGELSVVYPLVSTSYIWVSLLSVKYLGESMNRWKWLGIGFIILGVSVIGLGG